MSHLSPGSMLTLVGVLIVVVGFVLRINPLLVVTVAGLATGLASGLAPLAVVAAFGRAFITSRDVAGTGVSFSAVETIPVGPLPTSVRLVAAYNRFGFADQLVLASAGSTGSRQNPAYIDLTAGMQFESLSERPVTPYAHVGWGFFIGEGSVPSKLAGGDQRSAHPGGSVGGGIKFRAARRSVALEARYVTISGGDQYLPVTLGMSF